MSQFWGGQTYFLVLVFNIWAGQLYKMGNIMGLWTTSGVSLSQPTISEVADPDSASKWGFRVVLVGLEELFEVKNRDRAIALETPPVLP